MGNFAFENTVQSHTSIMCRENLGTAPRHSSIKRIECQTDSCLVFMEHKALRNSEYKNMQA